MKTRSTFGNLKKVRAESSSVRATNRTPAETRGPLPNEGERLLFAPVVFLRVNLAGELVLLVIEPGAVGGGQVAIVVGAHVVLFLVEGGFLGLHVGGFARGELAGVDAVV